MTSKRNILLADETVTIAGPISTVFDFLSNHENYVRWYPGAVSVTSSDGLPPGTVGKVYSETLRLPSGRNQDFGITVVECQAPHLFRTEGSLAPVYPSMEMRLTAASPTKTVLNLKFFSRSQSSLVRLAIRLLVRASVRRQTRAGLARLKALFD